MNTDTIKRIFQSQFDYRTYCNEIVHNIFGCNDIATSPGQLPSSSDGDQNYFIGRMADADSRELGFFYTRVAEGSDVRRKRVGLRKLIAPYLKYEVDAAIAVFDDGIHWRLSYICDMKEGATAAKRFSYILGDPQGQYKTPIERLGKVASKSGRFVLNDLKEAFSVDALSKEFFDEYHRHYDIIVKELEREGNSGTIYHDYVKKMLGRIVFLHFLQKKGWLDGNQAFLRDLFFMQPLDRRADFLEKVMEPLFFGIFNTEIGQRGRLFSDRHWDKQLLEDWSALPYLNGGLFEEDAVDKLHIKLPGSLFEDLFTFLASYNFTVDENDPDDAEVGVDLEMLGKIFESLLEDNKAKGAFYTPKEIVRYMCKESLIAYLDSKLENSCDVQNASERQNAQSANNPTQGTQCGDNDSDEKCVSETRDLKTAIRAFVEHHEMQPELEPYRNTLDAALRNVKICDPAIGSGAFPMGLLNELWRCREALMDAADTSERCDLSNTVQAKRSAVTSTEKPLRAGGTRPQSRVELKKQIIENNIYGVDIERGAIDIARLRFWLSIVVDAEEAEPLPNFDYKFMQGNSLIESFDGHDLSHIMDKRPTGRGGKQAYQRKIDGKEEIQISMDFSSDDTRQNLRIWLKKYFSLTDHKEKAHYRELINSSVKSYIKQQGIGPTAEAKLDKLDPSANQDFFLWHTWFKEIFDNGGFDIVIGNPPYGAKYSDECKHYYKTNYITARTIPGKQKGSLDTFTLFIEHGYNILKKDGNLANIVPIALTSSDSLTGVHRILLDKCDNIRISSYAVRPKPVFERAVVNTSILIFTKTETKCHNLFSTKMHRRNEGAFNLQNLIDNLQFTDVKEYLLWGRIPKIGSDIEKNILDKVNSHKKLSYYYKHDGSPIYYRTTGGRYFKIVTNYPTGSTKEKPLFFSSKYASSIGCILSSNLSFWFYQIYSNNLDWKTYEIENFTIPCLSKENIDYLEELYEKYLCDIEEKANVRQTTGESKYLVDSFKEYKIVRSKSIIDEIDDYIGPLYGLTQEEIDFIKNYELEFRMAGE